ncbi:MAG: AAA family ATPase [Pseudomonadota bacterium]|nr:AAA family ATPase [Pseudomonadota bacterium]
MNIDDLREAAADLPEQMASARRWLVWRSIPRPEQKALKVPYYANGKARKATDTPEDAVQLSTLDDAFNTLESGRYTGLAFALGQDDTGNHWQGVDLDDLSQRPELGTVADDLPGYTETSPSGDGRHAIGYGRRFDAMGSNGTGVEAYSNGRFFTVTCNAMGIGEPVDLADFVEKEIRPIHQRGKAAPPPADDTEPTPADVPTPSQVRELRSALNHLRADDRAVWVSIGHALKTAGKVGRGLWMDWSATSEKHDPASDAKTWDSFKPQKTGWRSVFAAAQSAGWVNPAGWYESTAQPPPEAKPSEKKPAFELVTARDLIANVRPPQWLVTDLIEADTLAQLFGQSGAGKSFVAIDWACCIATGEPWHGRPVRQGSVIYVAGEGHGGLSRRLKAWTHHRGVSLDNAPLFVSKTAAAFMDPTSAAAVTAAVDAVAAENEAPTLIVVDTLARNLGPGDENSNTDIGLFINALDALRVRYGCTVLIVHHSGHMDKGRARGASALKAAMDHEFQAEKRAHGITLTAQKMKEAEIPVPLNFELESVRVGTDDKGEPVFSAVLVSGCPPPKVDRPLTPSLQFGLDTYREAAREVGTLDANGEFAGLHVEQWRPVFYQSSTADNQRAKNKAFERARRGLVERGELSVIDDMYQLAGIVGAFERASLSTAILARSEDESAAFEDTATCAT